MRGHAALVGSYVEGNSFLHRASLSVKAVLLLTTSALTLCARFLPQPLDVAATTLICLALLWLYMKAKLPMVRMRQTAKGLAIFLVLIAAYQWWQNGPLTALLVVETIFGLVLASTIFTATTPVNVLLDGIERLLVPLKRFGADPERFALTVALMLRSLPFIIGAFADVRDAARARGLERNVLARTLPVVISTVGYARATGEALTARGLGDPALPELDESENY